MVKYLPVTQDTWVRSLGWDDPLEKGMAPTPVLLPGESHGQRSLAGYSPRGHKESDRTAGLTLSLSHPSHVEDLLSDGMLVTFSSLHPSILDS